MSKLSVGISDLFKYQDAGSVVAAMQPIAAKVLIGGEQVEKSITHSIYASCPNTWVVARITPIEGHFHSGQWASETPEAMAQRWVNEAMQFAVFFPDRNRTLLEGPFIMFADFAKANEYTRFENERQRLLAELGFRSVICDFAVGTPEPSFWPIFAPAMRRAKELGNVLGMQLYFPLYALDDWQWFAGRYQQVLEFYGTNPDCRIPIMAMEGGIDDCLYNNDARRAQVSNGIHTNGWRKCGAAFAWRGEQLSLPDAYYNELCSMDNQIINVPELACYLVFTYERRGAGWEQFDVHADGGSDSILMDIVNRVNPLVDGKRPVRGALYDLRLGDSQPTEPPVEPPIEPPQDANDPPFMARVKAGVRLNFRQDPQIADNIWRVLQPLTAMQVWQSLDFVRGLQASGSGWMCVKIGDEIGFVASSYCEWL